MLLSQTNQAEFQNVTGQFDGLVKKQGEQFQKLMDSFAQSTKKTDSSQA